MLRTCSAATPFSGGPHQGANFSLTRGLTPHPYLIQLRVRPLGPLFVEGSAKRCGCTQRNITWGRPSWYSWGRWIAQLWTLSRKRRDKGALLGLLQGWNYLGGERYSRGREREQGRLIRARLSLLCEKFRQHLHFFVIMLTTLAITRSLEGKSSSILFSRLLMPVSILLDPRPLNKTN